MSTRQTTCNEMPHGPPRTGGRFRPATFTAKHVLARLLKRRFRYPFVGEPVACNLCGGSQFDIVGKRDRFGGKLQTVLCHGCGLVFTNPMPTEVEVATFYREHYREDYHGSARPRRQAIARASKGAVQRFERLAAYLQSGTRVLDIGSGGGEFVAYLSRQGLEATGLEPNREFAAFSRDEYGITVEQTRWQDAQLPAGGFDFITAIHVLEHFRDPKAALVRFRDWLSAGGCLFISVPSIEVYHRSPHGRFHFAHLFNFNRESLVLMAEEAGLRVHDESVGKETEIVFTTGTSGTARIRAWDNYQKLRTYFDTHTSWNHYRTLTPYKRFVARLARRVTERRFVKHSRADAALLEKGFEHARVSKIDS